MLADNSQSSRQYGGTLPSAVLYKDLSLGLKKIDNLSHNIDEAERTSKTTKLEQLTQGLPQKNYAMGKTGRIDAKKGNLVSGEMRVTKTTANSSNAISKKKLSSVITNSVVQDMKQSQITDGTINFFNESTQNLPLYH